MLWITPDEWTKLLLAVGIGAIIGLEREFHNKAAGLRTITLITVGSTLFAMVSIHSGDNRIVANIVSGIGFLGAGVILFSGGRLRGLTTASSIWVAAAVGTAIGFGEYALSIVVALLVVVVLWLFAFVARFVEANARETLTYEIAYDRQSKVVELEAAFKAHKLYIRERKHFKRAEVYISQWQADGDMPEHLHFVTEILKDPEVKELRY